MLDPSRLNCLRAELARIEAAGAAGARPARTLTLQIAALDTALGGGLALGAVHEIAPAAPVHVGAATGFAVALARLAGRRGRSGDNQPRAATAQNEPNLAAPVRRHAIRAPDRGDASRAAVSQNEPILAGAAPVLWIQQDYARVEAGRPHGTGIALFGLPMARLVVLRVRQTRDALWAMEEALKSAAVAAVVMELAGQDAGADLTATRRLSLAAADGGGLGLILNHHVAAHPSAATTRWQVAAAPGARDAFGGLGATTFALSLVKNRRGPTGAWRLAWDHHECAFSSTLSVAVAETARDRPDRPRFARTG